MFCHVICVSLCEDLCPCAISNLQVHVAVITNHSEVNLVVYLLGNNILDGVGVAVGCLLYQRKKNIALHT